MKIKALYIFLLVLAILFSNNSKAKKQEVILQLKWNHQFQFAGYYMALEKGYYKDIGLEVIIKEGSHSCSPIDSVLDEKAMFGISGSELIIDKNNGKPITVLLAIYQHSPLVLIAKDVVGISNIHDIKGKRVMIENNSSELLSYLLNEGIDINSLVRFPYQNSMVSLINDSVNFISAYITDEPYYLKKRNIRYQVFKPQSSGIDFYGDILFTDNENIRQNPEMVAGFIQASKKGWEYALKHPDETIRIIYDKYSKEKEIEHLHYEAKESINLIQHDVVEIGYMYEGRWKSIGETFVKLGMLKNTVNTDNFLYNPKNYKDRLHLFHSSLSGFLILSGIIFLIILSYLIYKLLDNRRTQKSKPHGKNN